METDTWTRGPDLRRGKHHHTCNLVTHVDGTRDIVVMGGYATTLGYLNEVEIVHLDSNSLVLRTGANMPHKLYGHTTVAYEDKVVLIGGACYRGSGSTCSGYNKEIYG